MNFESLSRDLLSNADSLVPQWLPGGKISGREYSIGSLSGEVGDSLKVNLSTGKWADFAGNDKGGDLISLYAAINRISQAEAFKALSPNTVQSKAESILGAKNIKVGPPPATAPRPSCQHFKYGEAAAQWVYRSVEGSPLFVIARYDTATGKQIVPWSWDLDNERWVNKGWPTPRPLYALDVLAQSPAGKHILITEGEKSAEAARTICGAAYVSMTWPNGAKAVSKADWSVLKGRKVLLWPDADEAGANAMQAVAEILRPIASEIKILHYAALPNPLPDGWDAADALKDGMDWAKFKTWAQPLVSKYEPAAIVIDPPPTNVTNQTLVVQTAPEDTPQVSGSHYDMWERYGLAVTTQGQPIINVDNTLRAFKQHPPLQDLFFYDTFYKTLMITEDGTTRQWTDIDDLKLLVTLQADLGIKRMSLETVIAAARLYGAERSRCAPLEWLKSLTWDGKFRVDDFFATHFGADPESPYTFAASKNWWVSMCARIAHPGCKVDNMVILEGGQGKFKSTALSIIGGPWYAELTASFNDAKQVAEILNGKLLVEISELDAFSKSEVGTVKKLITCRTDRYRASYGRVAQDYPRQCVFVGTTNEDAYLRDSTGARRFWPITIGNIDLEAVKRDRDQLFAEAYHKYLKNETWWTMPARETSAAQEARHTTDEWEILIGDYVNRTAKDELRLSDVALDALKIEVSRLDLHVQRRIGSCLHRMGWRKHNRRVGGRQSKIWVGPDHLWAS